MGGKVEWIEGPCTFVSAAGVRKVLFILEDMEWTTVHPTGETDLPKLEELLVLSPSEEQALLNTKGEA
jgi:hypothetical protein